MHHQGVQWGLPWRPSSSFIGLVIVFFFLSGAANPREESNVPKSTKMSEKERNRKICEHLSLSPPSPSQVALVQRSAVSGVYD